MTALCNINFYLHLYLMEPTNNLPCHYVPMIADNMVWEMEKKNSWHFLFYPIFFQHLQLGHSKAWGTFFGQVNLVGRISNLYESRI